MARAEWQGGRLLLMTLILFGFFLVLIPCIEKISAIRHTEINVSREFTDLADQLERSGGLSRFNPMFADWPTGCNKTSIAKIAETFLLHIYPRFIETCQTDSLPDMRKEFLTDIFKAWIEICDKESLEGIWQEFKSDIHLKWLRSCRRDRILEANHQLEEGLYQLYQDWDEQCTNQSLAQLPWFLLRGGLDATNLTDLWDGPRRPVTTCSYWRRIMVFNLLLILFIGGPGNLLTVLAIPYVRMRYSDDFPRLRNTIAVLIVHLSVCDLLYMAVGFTHFIQINLLEHFPYSDIACLYLGIFRHIIVHADMYTTAAISSCVASHTICKECERAETFRDHHKHSLVFSYKGLVVLIQTIWVAAFLTIAYDISPHSGTEYTWTGRAYGCDTIRSKCAENEMTSRCVRWHKVISYGVFSLVILISYTLCISHLWKRKRERRSFFEVINRNTSERLTKRVMAMWVLLSICYIMFASSRLVKAVNYNPGVEVKAGLACFFWWMFGFNQILYLKFDPKCFKRAYTLFLSDIFGWHWRQTTRPRSQHTSDLSNSETARQWWEHLSTAKAAERTEAILRTDEGEVEAVERTKPPFKIEEAEAGAAGRTEFTLRTEAAESEMDEGLSCSEVTVTLNLARGAEKAKITFWTGYKRCWDSGRSSHCRCLVENKKCRETNPCSNNSGCRANKSTYEIKDCRVRSLSEDRGYRGKRFCRKSRGCRINRSSSENRGCLGKGSSNKDTGCSGHWSHNEDAGCSEHRSCSDYNGCKANKSCSDDSGCKANKSSSDDSGYKANKSCSDDSGYKANKSSSDDSSYKANKFCSDDSGYKANMFCWDGSGCKASKSCSYDSGYRVNRSCRDDSDCRVNKFCSDNSGCRVNRSCSYDSGYRVNRSCSDDSGYRVNKFCSDDSGCRVNRSCSYESVCNKAKNSCSDDSGFRDDSGCRVNRACSDDSGCRENRSCSNDSGCSDDSGCRVNRSCSDDSGCRENRSCSDDSGCRVSRSCNDYNGNKANKSCSDDSGFRDDSGCRVNRSCSDNSGCRVNRSCSNDSGCSGDRGCSDDSSCRVNRPCSDDSDSCDDSSSRDDSGSRVNRSCSDDSGCRVNRSCSENTGCRDDRVCRVSRSCSDNSGCRDDSGCRVNSGCRDDSGCRVNRSCSYNIGRRDDSGCRVNRYCSDDSRYKTNKACSERTEAAEYAGLSATT